MSDLLPLFNIPVFHGPDVTASDAVRLETQLGKVEAYMRSGEWRTLRQIAQAAGCSEPSASARLRQLRSLGWTVERRRDAEIRGLFHYRAAK